MELTFQTGAFRQRIQRLLVVIQGLQTLFHLVEVDGVQIAALRCGGERHVQRGHIVRQLVLRVDDVVEFGGQHRPSAVRNEHVHCSACLATTSSASCRFSTCAPTRSIDLAP